MRRAALRAPEPVAPPGGLGLLRLDRELAVRAELRDLRAAHAGRVERAAEASDVGALLELELHERAAGELDAVPQAAGDEHRAEAEGDECRGTEGHRAPPADEVVARVVEDADHGRGPVGGRQMLSARGAVERPSQSM
jgi:hypothetical protein